MSGSIILPSITQIESQRLGYNGITLTNYNDTAEPEIAKGSKVEIGGALYAFTDTTDIDTAGDWAGISTGTQGYLYLKTTDTETKGFMSTVAPTWDSEKQGWYSTESRCVATIYKDSDSAWTRKHVLNDLYQNSEEPLYIKGDIEIEYETSTGGLSKKGLKKKIIEIGDWDMPASLTLDKDHGVDHTAIRSIEVLIRGDSGSTYQDILFPIDWNTFTAVAGNYRLKPSGSLQINLSRQTGGFFDNANFDSTGFNRGWIRIEYEV